MANPIPLWIRLWKASWGNDLSTKEGEIGFWADFSAGTAGFMFGSMLGGVFGGPMGFVTGVGFSMMAPTYIERWSLAYSAPFTALSIHPLTVDPERLRLAREKWRQIKLAQGRVKPTRGPVFASPAHQLLRCPPGYHLKDGACIED